MTESDCNLLRALLNEAPVGGQSIDEDQNRSDIIGQYQRSGFDGVYSISGTRTACRKLQHQGDGRTENQTFHCPGKRQDYCQITATAQAVSSTYLNRLKKLDSFHFGLSGRLAIRRAKVRRTSTNFS